MRRSVAFPLIGLAVALSCYVVAQVEGSDPMLVVEAVGIVVLAVWVLAVARRVMATGRAAHRLGTNVGSRRIAGVRVHVLDAAIPAAFVAGILRPSIFVTSQAFRSLTRDELRAVVAHEEHHRRTRSPLRTAFVEAWTVVLPFPSVVERWVEGRVAADEMAADRFALTRGATRPILASALLKTEPGPGVGFASRDELRVRALLGEPLAPIRAAWLEWIPLITIVAAIVGCQLAGVATPL